MSKHAGSATSPAPIGSAADRALDTATKGKVGTVRRGFHTLMTPVRFTDARSGLPGLKHVTTRCTCGERYNHVAAVSA